MTAIEQKFGYYPQHIEIDCSAVTIKTLDTLEADVLRVGKSIQVYDDWMYAPPASRRDMFSGEVTKKPFPDRIFGLPKTHSIEVRGQDTSDAKAHALFTVWCLSFFVGMRLTNSETGFIDTTPIKEGRLVDFDVQISDLNKILGTCNNFYFSNSSNNSPNVLCSAIHSFFIGQNKQYMEYERFKYYYLSIDACFRVAIETSQAKPPKTHADRLEWMCSLHGISCPSWARSSGGQGSILSAIRNELFHEATWNQKPLGFRPITQHSPKNLNLELRALLGRIIVAQLGIQTKHYVSSPTDTRSRYPLDVR